MTSAVRDDVAFALAKEALPLCFYHTELSVLSKNTLVNAVVVAQFTFLLNDSFQWPLCPSSPHVRRHEQISFRTVTTASNWLQRYRVVRNTWECHFHSHGTYPKFLGFS